MLSPGQHLISLFRAVTPAAVITFLVTLVALPGAAQNSVPPTAVQAAKMPQFAKRLTHPASTPNPAPAHQASRRRPPQGNDLYDNGPINGNTDAWTINFGFIVSDTITLSGESTVTGMSFGAWLFPGDTLTSAEISITSEPNGGTVYFDQTVNFTPGLCISNEFGYNVCTETSSSFQSAGLPPGTYWVNLQNASVPTGSPVYWDENSGVGCQSSGCPSQADNNSVGSIPSESFTILGSSGPPSCSSQEDPQNIRNRQPQAAAPGTTPWWETVLHSFGNGADGNQPDYGSLILDGAGNLYGTTMYGGSHACGTVFELSPNGSGGWTERVIHNFVDDGVDGWYPDTGLIMDSAGNLYGGTTYGPGYGTVFEVSPSGGGEWTERVIYSFTGLNNDGRYPAGLTFDSAGNILGTTSNGGPSSAMYNAEAIRRRAELDFFNFSAARLSRVQSSGLNS